MELLKKRITDLVKDNPLLAKALHFLGIRFDNYPEKTLEEVCNEKNISSVLLVKHLEEAGAAASDLATVRLSDYPIDLVVQYLRHAHHIFIKQRLPYLMHLVESLDENRAENKQTVVDLKFVFPIFAHDYIVHVYEEEDTLFTYINTLLAATRKINNPSALFYLMEKNSVPRFSNEHIAHDDQMEGIALLTNHFAIGPNTDLPTQVAYSELKQFRQELIIHANIEDRILFPKALHLENEVKWRMSVHTGQN